MSRQLKLPTLLIVSDNPSVRFWVKKYFDESFFVIAAEKKQEALEALNARLDFIIVDASFEEYDALDLCKELSKLTQKNLVPIFLITGRLKKSFRDQAFQSGVTEFLSNQLDLEEFKEKIEMGKKAASLRQKTEDLGFSIKAPKPLPNALKHKVVLDDPALRLLAVAKKEKTSIALLFLRVDGFVDKECPEEIRLSLTTFIQGMLREKDMLIPSIEGGLILLLSNMTSESARVVAEKLRAKIQYHTFSTSKGPLQLTVSMVISSPRTTEKEFRKAMEAAAKSLKTHPEANTLISLDTESL